ncbi:hypothetical protein [Flavobacterium sp.]|uniref:hypothetical protein n=1 Tax=Flavobacterium sp. TaxID=239 RepID=UPI0025D6E2CC|nr:hypothetical protein [Flavobacterium sp.]
MIAVEYLYKNYLENPLSNKDVIYNIRIFEKDKEMEKQQRGYSEEDMKEAIMFGVNGMYGWQIGEEGYTNNQIKRFLETFKK